MKLSECRPAESFVFIERSRLPVGLRSVAWTRAGPERKSETPKKRLLPRDWILVVGLLTRRMSAACALTLTVKLTEKAPLLPAASMKAPVSAWEPEPRGVVENVTLEPEIWPGAGEPSRVAP